MTFCLLLILLWKFDFININVAEINVKDINAKVLYHYENNDEPFTGYNERAKIYFKDSFLDIKGDYLPKLKEVTQKYSNCSIDFEIEDTRIIDVKDTSQMELCLDKASLEVMKRKNNSFLTDTIYFEYESELNVLVEPNTEHQRRSRTPRSFWLSCEFTITGLYDTDFIHYQIAQIILLKLKPIIYDYLAGYHGVFFTRRPKV